MTKSKHFHWVKLVRGKTNVHGAGSTVPQEGFDSSVIMPFFLVSCGCDTVNIASVHIQRQASLCTL